MQALLYFNIIIVIKKNSILGSTHNTIYICTTLLHIMCCNEC
jgi:hypothetical protein